MCYSQYCFFQPFNISTNYISYLISMFIIEAMKTESIIGTVTLIFFFLNLDVLMRSSKPVGVKATADQVYLLEMLCKQLK